MAGFEEGVGCDRFLGCSLLIFHFRLLEINRGMIAHGGAFDRMKQSIDRDSRRGTYPVPYLLYESTHNVSVKSALTAVARGAGEERAGWD